MGNSYSGTTLAQVEIECSDCHGTDKKYPWELKLGYGEKELAVGADDKSRGVTKKLPVWMTQELSYKPYGWVPYSPTRGKSLSEKVGKRVMKGLVSLQGEKILRPLLKKAPKKGLESSEAKISGGPKALWRKGGVIALNNGPPRWGLFQGSRGKKSWGRPPPFREPNLSWNIGSPPPLFLGGPAPLEGGGVLLTRGKNPPRASALS